MAFNTLTFLRECGLGIGACARIALGHDCKNKSIRVSCLWSARRLYKQVNTVDLLHIFASQICAVRQTETEVKMAPNAEDVSVCRTAQMLMRNRCNKSTVFTGLWTLLLLHILEILMGFIPIIMSLSWKCLRSDTQSIYSKRRQCVKDLHILSL